MLTNRPPTMKTSAAALCPRNHGSWMTAFALGAAVALGGCDAAKSSGSSPPTNTDRGSGGSNGSGMMMMMGSMGGMKGGPFGPSGSGGNGGQSGGAGGDSGSQMPPPAISETGTTTAKFCNPVWAQNNQSVEFMLEVGTKFVRFQAPSGKCVPVVGQACTTIPAGTGVPIRISIPGRTLGETVINVMPNKPVVFFMDVDDMGQLGFGGGAVPAASTCEAFDPIEMAGGGMPPGDAGAPTPKPDAGAGNTRM